MLIVFFLLLWDEERQTRNCYLSGRNCRRDNWRKSSIEKMTSGVGGMTAGVNEWPANCLNPRMDTSEFIFSRGKIGLVSMDLGEFQYRLMAAYSTFAGPWLSLVRRRGVGGDGDSYWWEIISIFAIFMGFAPFWMDWMSIISLGLFGPVGCGLSIKEVMSDQHEKWLAASIMAVIRHGEPHPQEFLTRKVD